MDEFGEPSASKRQPELTRLRLHQSAHSQANQTQRLIH